MKTSIPTLGDQNTVEPCISFFDWYQAIEDYKSMDDTTWGVRHYVDGNLKYA